MPHLSYSKLILASVLATLVGCGSSSGGGETPAPTIDCNETPKHESCAQVVIDELTVSAKFTIEDTNYALYVVGDAVGTWETAYKMTFSDDTWTYTTDGLELTEGASFKYILGAVELGDEFVINDSDKKLYFWLNGENLSVSKSAVTQNLTFEGITCDTNGCEPAQILTVALTVDYLASGDEVLYVLIADTAYKLSENNGTWSTEQSLLEGSTFHIILAKSDEGEKFTLSSDEEGKTYVYANAAYTVDGTNLAISNLKFNDFTSVSEVFNATVGIEYTLENDEVAVFVKFEDESDAEKLMKDGDNYISDEREFDDETNYVFYISKSSTLNLNGVNGEDFITSTGNYSIAEAGEEISSNVSFSNWMALSGEFTFDVMHDVGDGFALYIVGGNGADSWNEVTRMTYSESSASWTYASDDYKAGESYKFIKGFYDLGGNWTIKDKAAELGKKWAWLAGGEATNLIMKKDNSVDGSQYMFEAISEMPKNGGTGTTPPQSNKTITPSFEIKAEVGDGWGIYVSGGTNLDNDKSNWNNANRLEYREGAWRTPSTGNIKFDWFVEGAEFNIIKAPYVYGASFETMGASDKENKEFTWRNGDNFKVMLSYTVKSDVMWNSEVSLPKKEDDGNNNSYPCGTESMYMRNGTITSEANGKGSWLVNDDTKMNCEDGKWVKEFRFQDTGNENFGMKFNFAVNQSDTNYWNDGGNGQASKDGASSFVAGEYNVKYKITFNYHEKKVSWEKQN